MLLKPVLVLCLGNEIIADDSFGFAVSNSLAEEIGENESIEVLFAARAGYFLIDSMFLRRRVLIVDSIRTESDPAGTLRLHSAGEFTPSRHLVGSHQISLPTALKLAKELDLPMPPEIDVLTVEALDLETLTESMTPEVAAAVPRATKIIHNWLANEESYVSH